MLIDSCANNSDGCLNRLILTCSLSYCFDICVFFGGECRPSMSAEMSLLFIIFKTATYNWQEVKMF